MSVQWFFSGTWYDMNRVNDNYFVIQAINNQPLVLPAQIKITSIFNDTVIDTIPGSSPQVRRCALLADPCSQLLPHLSQLWCG